MTDVPCSYSRLRSALPWLMLAVILIASLSLHVNNLGHAGVKDLDEAYHAVVARSMLDDPLKPTLYATAWLPYDFTDWQHNHVWLHKPPVALWQIAGSLAVFGESNFALRLPSALFATAAVALTFLIGRSLVSVSAGLIAAALQAMSPAIIRLVHGQVFADHVDIAMLFWSELAVWLLIRAARTGRLSDAALVGVAQAIAWMTKSYPALFISGLAVLLFLLQSRSSLHASLPASGQAPSSDPAFRHTMRQLVVFLITAILTAAPWVVLCLVRYPREFLYEQGHVFRHLGTNIENFAAPWDRLLADYLQRGFLEWYALAIVATLVITIDTMRAADSRRLFLAAWAWGVLVPHLFATSKTPTATLIGWPAGWLAIGVMFSDALRGRRLAVGITIAAGVLLIAWPLLPRESTMGYGPNYRFGSIAVANWPIAVSVFMIAVVGIAASAVRPPQRRLLQALPIVLLLVFCFPVYRHVRRSLATSQDVPRDPVAFARLGQIVRAQSPENAVFLVDVRTRGEAVIAMWWLDRECYPLRPEQLDVDVATIISNGGQAFLLSRGERAETPLLRVEGEAAIFPLITPASRPAP